MSRKRQGAATVYTGSSCDVTGSSNNGNSKPTRKRVKNKNVKTKSTTQLRPVAFCGKNKGFFTMMKEDFYGANSCSLNNNTPNEAQLQTFRKLEFQYFQCGQNIMSKILADKKQLTFLKYELYYRWKFLEEFNTWYSSASIKERTNCYEKGIEIFDELLKLYEEHSKTGGFMVEEADVSETKNRRIYAAVQTDAKINHLVQATGLDKKEIKSWLKEYFASGNSVTQNLPFKDTEVKQGQCYTVPNVWIIADCMQGGDIIDRGFLNFGGTIGRLAWNNCPDGCKKVEVNDLSQLEKTIFYNHGNIRGFVMYAHGNELGFISDNVRHLRIIGLDFNNKTNETHTLDLISVFRCNGFKIAEAYPRQCYSTFVGTYEVKFTTKDYKGVSCTAKERQTAWEHSYFISTKIKPFKREFPNKDTAVSFYRFDWKNEWKKVTVKVDGYQGLNVLGADTAFLE